MHRAWWWVLWPLRALLMLALLFSAAICQLFSWHGRDLAVWGEIVHEYLFQPPKVPQQRMKEAQMPVPGKQWCVVAPFGTGPHGQRAAEIAKGDIEYITQVMEVDYDPIVTVVRTLVYCGPKSVVDKTLNNPGAGVPREGRSARGGLTISSSCR